jgi:hypothetical protein
MKTSTIALLALVSSASAFQSVAPKQAFSSTQLHAESRRAALGAIGIALGGLMFGAEPSNAGLQNPALQTFKGGKKTKGAFIPGKGLRNQEDFDTLVADALQTMRERQRTGPRGPPGRGIRNTMEFDELVAGLDNPALQTFKGKKRTKGAFIPGKGIRNTMEFDELVAGLDNPALQTFKGRKRTKGAFIPGKGIRLNEGFDTLMG